MDNLWPSVYCCPPFQSSPSLLGQWTRITPTTISEVGAAALVMWRVGKAHLGTYKAGDYLILHRGNADPSVKMYIPGLEKERSKRPVMFALP